MNNNKRPYSNILLIILIIFSIIAVFAIAIGSFFAFYKKSIFQGNIGLLLTVGIGMMGILVALKAAFDISNVINRRDIDRLTADIDIANERVQDLLKNNLDIQAERFFVAASENYWDPVLKKIIQKFPKPTNLGITSNIFSSLTIIELKYTQVYKAHRSKYYHDENLISIADEGIGIINSILDNKKKLPSKSIMKYLNYRKSGFKFFSGYCAERAKIGADNFNQAKDYYIDLKKSFKDKAIKCHLANSIGECYSKIVHYYSAEDIYSGMSEDEKKAYKPETLLDYSNKAIEYFEEAIKEKELFNDPTLSVFYRNCGAAYERQADLKNRLNKEDSAIPLSDNKNKIFESYLNALKYAKKDENTANPAKLKGAYRAYLTYAYKNKDSITDPQLLKEIKTISEEAKNSFPWFEKFQKAYDFFSNINVTGTPIAKTPVDPE